MKINFETGVMARNSEGHGGLLQRKLLIVSGKGGVGKSATSAILARLAARVKRRVLVVQSDPNYDAPVNLHNMLGGQPVDSQEKELHPHLWAMRSDPESAMRYALLSVIRSKFLYNKFFQSDLIRGVVDAVPGLREAFLMYHVHAMAVYGSGRRHFDLVIWDAPPTGHLPLYLKSPAILSRMFSRGYVYKVLRGLADFLRDPAQVALCLVTLPEETPVSETLQLAGQLERDDLGHVGGIVVNSFPDLLLTRAEARDCRTLMAGGPGCERLIARLGGEPAGALLATARRRLEWEKLAGENVRPLAEQSIPSWTLPHFPAGRVTLAEVDQAVERWLTDPAAQRYLFGETSREAAHK